MNSRTTSHSTNPNGQTGERPRPFFSAAADGFRAARSDAEKAAKDALPKLQSFFGEAAYDASYVAGYGAFFSLTLIKELLPERVRSGFEAGARRGKHVAETVTQSETDSTAAAAI
jgi:hypothetical protein